MSFMLKPESLNKIMILAPHCDDEVIGCGGLLLRCLKDGKDCEVIYFTEPLSKEGAKRNKEAENAWHDYPSLKQIFFGFPDSQLEQYYELAIDKLSHAVEEFNPESFFLPWPFDQHTDHRIMYKILNSSLKTTENIKIYFYEVFYPLYSNCSLNITDVFEEKIRLIEAFESQRRLKLTDLVFTLNSFRATAIRLKKIKYVEAFFCLTEQHSLLLQTIYSEISREK